jgi:uncharacterized repeat protein (TIGR03803 family)
MQLKLMLPTVLALLAQSAGAADVTFNVVYSFGGPGNLTATPTSIVEVSPGKFMGTGSNGAELFSISSDGAYNNIYVFPQISSGLTAWGLTPALNNQVYGGAEAMGTSPTFSELYSVSTAGAFTAYPYNPATQGGTLKPVQDPDNHLYSLFGIEGGPATFAQLDYEGHPATLHTFTAAEGAPSSLFLGADAAFYGISFLDNYSSAGIFRLTTDGVFSWVVPSFSKVGNQYPVALMEAANGKFYGTLTYGGAAGAGAIFEAALGGQMRTIYEFPERNTGIPATLIQASDGLLYGTAIGEDTDLHNNAVSSIFRLDPSSGAFETLYRFAGRDCECQLVQGSDGRIFGISYYQSTAGTFFVLDAGLSPPQPFIGTIAPASGPVGQLVLLWGRNVLGATAVSFNGTPALTFSVPTTQGIWAQVPAGATSGPITVTTPHGSYTTGQSFTVE